MRYYNKKAIVIAFKWDHMVPTLNLEYLYNLIEEIEFISISVKRVARRDFEFTPALILTEIKGLKHKVLSGNWIVIFNNDTIEIYDSDKFENEFLPCVQ